MYAYRTGPISANYGLDEYSITGDTIVNGLNYKIMNSALIREDTIQKKIFIKCYYCLGTVDADTVERLLYDFSLQIGDTANFGIGKYLNKYTVTKIDSTLINGSMQKIFYYDSYYGVDFDGIEGIGSTSGPWFSLTPTILDQSHTLCSFENSGIRPSVNPPVEVTSGAANFWDNKYDCVLTIINNTNKLTIDITPNPANEYSTINFPYTIQQGQLLIINSLGQVVADREIHNRQQLRLGSLSTSGLYYYKVIDKQIGNNFSGRFVYQ